VKSDSQFRWLFLAGEPHGTFWWAELSGNQLIRSFPFAVWQIEKDAPMVAMRDN
jgi:hypothetical protein